MVEHEPGLTAALRANFCARAPAVTARRRRSAVGRWGGALALLWLAGCQTPPPAKAPASGSPAAAPSGGAGSAGETATVPPAALPAETAAPAAPAGERPAPPAPLRADEIRAVLDQVRVQLDQGHDEAALEDLQRVLAADPQHKVAQSFLRQLREDPVALYGRESWPYKVLPGDGLATIAQRFLNDRDQFWGLARYNGIRSPRQLAVGQTIRIPGRQPARLPPPLREAAGPGSAPPAAGPAAAGAPSPAPPPVPAAAAAVPAPTPAPAPVAAPEPAPDPAQADRQRRARIDELKRTARTAMARQDVCGALRAWDDVLALDPNDRTAALEREKAFDLKRRLPSARC